MRTHAILCATAVALLVAGGCTSAPAPASAGGGGSAYRRGLEPWLDGRDRGVVYQGFDYSCGTASLATLLSYYYGDDVSEAALLKDIFDQMTDAEVQDRTEKGLLMLDLQHAAERRGYEAKIGGLAIEKLPLLRTPALVWVIRDGYAHFVILRGVVEDRVYVADPSAGNVRMSVDEFRAEYQQRALLLRKKGYVPPPDYALRVEEEIPIRTELPAVRRALSLDRGRAQ